LPVRTGHGDDARREGWCSQVEFVVSRPADGQYPVVGVRGEVDVSSAPALQQRLAELFVTAGSTVVVDLTDVSFLDSTGLGALVAARNSAADAGGSLPLVCTSERILKLFTITGLAGAFQFHPSVAEALQSLGAGPDAG
jgi:anti-sigma B factor antagonist